VVITDGDSWDTRVTAEGAVVETATVPITADMKELEETAEAFGIGIAWQSGDDVVLQAIPLSPGNNQTRSPWCASSLQAAVVNHSMKKGKEEILNSGEFTTSLKGSSPKGLRAVSSIQKSIDCKNSYQKKDDCWNEISSVEKRVNFHFQSSKGNMRSDSGQQSSPNAGRREEYDEKEELKLGKSSFSGDLSCDSMVVNKPPDAVSATRSGFSLHLATVQEAKVAAAQAANHIVATRLELSLHRAAVTEVVAHSVEDQVATQW